MPPDKVRSAQAFSKAQREGHQEMVTRVVSEAVVYLLEPVEVNEQYCQPARIPLRLDECVVQKLVEQCAVRQAGQKIVVGELADLLLRGRARNELPNLQADGLAHAKQGRIRLANFTDEELQHATKLVPDPYRERERAMQLGLGCDGCAQKSRLARDVGDPDGLASRPRPPDQACLGRRQALKLAQREKFLHLARVDTPHV